MAGATSDPRGSGFQHKPLAGLAALKARLPAAAAEDPGGAGAAGPEASPAADAGCELGAKLVVQRERKKRGGKTVTRIRGLAGDGPARAALAKELARALGCGASVEEGDILLQGAQVERAAAWLERRGAARVIQGN